MIYFKTKEMSVTLSKAPVCSQRLKQVNSSRWQISPQHVRKINHQHIKTQAYNDKPPTDHVITKSRD